jgi:hypothetical protein
LPDTPTHLPTNAEGLPAVSQELNVNAKANPRVAANKERTKAALALMSDFLIVDTPIEKVKTVHIRQVVELCVELEMGIISQVSEINFADFHSILLLF